MTYDMPVDRPELGLGEPYTRQLTEEYGRYVSGQLAGNWRLATVPEYGEDAKVAYVRAGEGVAVHERPVLFLPGFTEGIVSKAPLAAEMVSLGYDFILPDQHRKPLLADAEGQKDATRSQAELYLAIVEAEELTDAPVDVLTHSYGSLVFETMYKIAKERGWTCFDDADLIELAPSGSSDKEGFARLAGRFALNMIAETFASKDFKDPKGEMMKAGAKNMFANAPRSLREVRDLSRRKIDYEQLALSSLRSITILGYAQDKLFPHRLIGSRVRRAIELPKVSYANPYSLQDAQTSRLKAYWHTKIRGKELETRNRGGRDATHNDEQFNPSRVAGAVDQILQLRAA